MSRPKGFKLSAEQKAKMQEGRIKRALKAKEGLIETEEKNKKEKPSSFDIIGYCYDKESDSSVPVFRSEKQIYSDKVLYKTSKDARENKGK